MEKETIKNVGQAYLQVQENQKAALQKKLAKASAGSEEGKKKVTLPKAPFEIPKKKIGEKVTAAGQEIDKEIKHDCATHVEHAQWGKGQPISEQHTIVETAPGEGYVTHYDVMFEHGIEKNVAVEDLNILAEMSHGHSKKKKNEAMDPVNKKALKGTHADRDDKDIDNDGDVDSSDKFLHKKRKAITKNISKGKSDEIEMNPKKTKEKDSMTVENTLPPVYAKILENRAMHYKKAAAASPQGEGMSPGGKKMKADLEDGAKMDDTEEKGHKDASAAGRKGPARKPRSNDNMKGDKAIINPAKDTTKAG